MTKVTILGQEPTEKKELKKIEFVSFLSVQTQKILSKNLCGPSSYKHIELIKKGDKIDIMFAYDNYREHGFIYLGHFNDGIV